MTNTPSGFSGLGIAPKLLEALSTGGFTTPTPIQAQAIPIALEGKDVMGIAQTGTGKTLAFGIPMLQQLAKTNGVGLVVLPTRELALQVDESIHRIGRTLGVRTAVLIGGASMQNQVRDIRKKPHIYIVTPGRMNDHLEQRTVDLSNVQVLVLDEADRMLDMGFEPQIRRILQSVPPKRQTMLFSATMPQEIVKMATSYMQLPVRVEIARAGTASANVTQEVFIVPKDKKPALLEKLLHLYKGSILVFSRTKHGAKKITHQLRIKGFTAAEIHSDRSLAQRRAALEGFKTGRTRVLVATDIAARGIDVQGIELVINYDLPDHSEDYIHRIGRTGRAGRSGVAISFAAPDQMRDLRDIERLTRTALKITPLPDLPAPAPMTEEEKIRAYREREIIASAPRRMRGEMTARSYGSPRGYGRSDGRSDDRRGSFGRSAGPARHAAAPQTSHPTAAPTSARPAFLHSPIPQAQRPFGRAPQARGRFGRTGR